MAYDNRTKDIVEYAGRRPGVVTGAVSLRPARSSRTKVRARLSKLARKLTLLGAPLIHANDATLGKVAF
jgi:hypothetical protein